MCISLFPRICSGLILFSIRWSVLHDMERCTRTAVGLRIIYALDQLTLPSSLSPTTTDNPDIYVTARSKGKSTEINDQSGALHHNKHMSEL
ncbi:hypothetical protein DFS33DRAFT_1280608 [Desarmillaria ectypa]|nr:hypothetical protein DFS33DRAFT_1280608 [Desarmillaria ectypa]